MVGRNNPCTCGSGKKYKKCCGSKGIDLVDLIVNEELDRVLTGYFDAYPQGEARKEMLVFMRKWASHLTKSWEKEHVEEAASEFYLFIQQPKMWHSYLDSQLKQASRRAVIEVLKAWDEPMMLLAEITSVEKQALVVRTLFDEREYRLARNEGMPADIGTLLFGVVLRDARKGENAVAPVSSMLFLAKWCKQTKHSLLTLWEAAAKKTAEEFIHTHVLEIYELFIVRSMASMNELVEDVLAPAQLNALTVLDQSLDKLAQTANSREMMHKLCVAYFMNENPKVTNVEDFVAAALEIGVTIGVVSGKSLTKQSIAKKFNVVEEDVAHYMKELATLYTNMMDSEDAPVAARIYNIGTDPRPTEKALWETSMTTSGVVQPERKPTVAGARAQLLAFEAYGAETEEARRELAKSAENLNHLNADVLLLKAEIETNEEKAIELYEKAIQEASRTFDPGENPWQNIPNRPFMRAAFAYGIYLFEHGDFNGAASLFTDLLKMNRVDNQGARYEAIASLIHAKRFEEAAQILISYEKGSEHDAAYLYLDWKLEFDGSGGESASATEMLQTAANANSHVIHLKTFKTKSISYPRFQVIEPGSVEEARYIWLLLNPAR